MVHDFEYPIPGQMRTSMKEENKAGRQDSEFWEEKMV